MHKGRLEWGSTCRECVCHSNACSAVCAGRTAASIVGLFGNSRSGVACAQLTEGQLQPAADKFSAEAEPQMKRFTEGGIRPAADQLDEQARAAAQQVWPKALVISTNFSSYLACHCCCRRHRHRRLPESTTSTKSPRRFAVRITSSIVSEVVKQNRCSA